MPFLQCFKAQISLPSLQFQLEPVVFPHLKSCFHPNYMAVYSLALLLVKFVLQHQYRLVNMIDRILTILDSNSTSEKYAVIAQLIDWSKAFDRQDAELGIKAFISTGVRPTLVPILMSFFQDRKMNVKWHGCISTSRNLPGGNPQGSTLGLLQYEVN